MGGEFNESEGEGLIGGGFNGGGGLMGGGYKAGG